MKTKNFKKYVLTYGMPVVSLCILSLYRILDKGLVFDNITFNKETIQTLFIITAVLVMHLCSIYIIKIKEVPRIGLPSITGIGAIIIGWILFISLVIVEVNLIIDAIRIILK